MNNLLVAEKLTKSYGIRKLFDEINLSIHENDKIVAVYEYHEEDIKRCYKAVRVWK